MKRTTPIALLPALLLLIVAPLRAEQATFERWYVVMLGEDRIGHLHSREHEANGRITTTESLRVALRRGAAPVEIEQSWSFTETQAGRPVEAMMRMSIAQQPMVARFTFSDAGIDVVRQTAGRTLEENLPPLAGQWLTPAAARRYAQQQAEAGEEQIAVALLDITSGSPTVTGLSLTRLGEQPVQVMGKTVPAEAWDATASNAPGVTMRQYLDADGRMLRTTVSLGMFEMELLAADEAVALSPVDPPELVASTLVEPVGELANPRQLRRALYRLTLPEAYKGGLLRAGYQRVTWADERTALVVVDLDEPINPAGDEADASHLAATSMLDHRDERLGRLVEAALGRAPQRLTAAQKAERLRAFVHRYVTTKNLSVGFATATEVVRTAEGDCTEHAVLLAAMLRAAQIPSRTVTGLIYVDHFLGRDRVFGYHMWTQAWLEPADGGGARWIDLDATLDDPFDAAHLAILTSAMGEGALFNDMVGLIPLLSELRIEVIEAK